MASSAPSGTHAASALTGPLVPRRFARAWLIGECIGLYALIPVLLWLLRESFAQRIVPSLVLLAAVFTALLLNDPAFDRNRLWNTRELRAGLVRMLKVLLPSSVILLALTWWLSPGLFLRLPRADLQLWSTVMIVYPLLSVYPQEILFRTFFFHRYRGLFPNPNLMVAASALAFGLAHVFFANWLAPVLSTAGGWLFARTYLRSRSTLQASLEHGLWGDVIFTVGLGWYFYGGSIGR